MNSPRKILLLILFFAFLARIGGMDYGLPLWLVADEPPFTLGALKMMELKTALPRFHEEEFLSVLYYPPYLSYFYLPFFSGVLGLKFISFEGVRDDFRQYLGSDLSDFFRTSRLINIFLALFSIFLVYKTGKNIFRDDFVSLASAFFLATSLLYILLSTVSRHWLSVSLVFILGIYFLTNPSFSFKKRYFLAVLTTGLAMGISTVSGIFLVFIAFFYFFFDKKNILDVFKEKYYYFLFFMFAVLAFLPAFLYPGSFGFGRALTLFSDKSFYGFFSASILFLKPLVNAEPIFISAALLGLIFLFFKKRELFWIFLIFIIAWAEVFYTVFRFEHRFLVPLLPMLSLLAGFGLVEFFKWFYPLEKFIAILLLFLAILMPLIFASRLGYLIYKDDSRANLRSWIEENLPESSKVVTAARLFRLSSVKEGIAEQQNIDKNSLREADRSEFYFGRSPHFPSFHALNLYSVENPSFYENMEDYLKENSYEYLVLSPQNFQRSPALLEKFKILSSGVPAVISFGEGAGFSVSESELGKSPWELFRINELGPEITLYKLK